MEQQSQEQQQQQQQSLQEVRVSSLAAAKIEKHCEENLPSLVTGQLLGLDVGSTLEVSNCFPYPADASTASSSTVSTQNQANAQAEQKEEEAASAWNASEDKGNDKYQLDMLRCLREVNVDSNTVGWYQSTHLGSFHTEQLIETFMSYDARIKRCVCLVFDPQARYMGTQPLRAISVTNKIKDMKQAGEITADRVNDLRLRWNHLFHELHVRFDSSSLARALSATVSKKGLKGAKATHAAEGLKMGLGGLLERHVSLLDECLDDHAYEMARQAAWQKQSARMQSQRAQWLQKRRQENAWRRSNGLEPLPEEDMSSPALRLPPEPARLDELLIANQMSAYSKQARQLCHLSNRRVHILSCISSSLS